MRTSIAAILATCLSTLPVPGQGTEPSRRDDHKLSLQEGKITVTDGIATIDLPEGWSYLQQQDARFVLERERKQPPDPSVVGLVVPPMSLDGSVGDWTLVVRYLPDGWVDDRHAAQIDFDVLLAQAREAAAARNAARKQTGQPELEVTGWAEAPRYDSIANTLYLPKKLRAAGSGAETVDYELRLLGRHGSLVLTGVTDLDRLAEVALGSRQILQVTEFVAGQRYADFDPASDTVAELGIDGHEIPKTLAEGGPSIGMWISLVLALVGGTALVKVFGAKKRRELPEQRAA